MDWTKILELGADPAYYQVREWLADEGIINMAAGEFHQIKKGRTPASNPSRLPPITMWLSLLLQELRTWPIQELLYEIAQNVNVRCFIGLQDLTTPGPSEGTLNIFLQNYHTTIADMLQTVADVWVGVRQTQKTVTRSDYKVPSWINLMDNLTSRRSWPFVFESRGLELEPD